jgi:AcrR family transcriptional regulator
MSVISHRSGQRGRLPRGPHKLTSEQVAEDQRARLIDAIVRFVGEGAYARTTVADIIKRAGVSRKTFYAHFADRDRLLLAAFDATTPIVLEEARTASQLTGGPTRRLEALMRQLCYVARKRPSAIALATIEIAAAPEGLERRERLMGDYGELIDECLRAGETQPVLPSTLSRTIASGVHRTIDAYLRTGQRGRLKTLAPEFARWTGSYHPMPASLSECTAPSPPWTDIRSEWLVGGRAPGTLTLAPNGYQPAVRKRSAFIQHANRERILDAVAQLTTAHGYTALTAQSIAEHTDLSEQAFLAHFKNKDDAFAAAIEIGHTKGQAIVARARTSAPNWRTGVRYAIQALLDFLASEPYFTRLAFVDAPLAGPEMARRTYEHAGAYARLLLDEAPQRRRPPPVAPKTIVNGLFELAFHYAALNRASELANLTSEAVYLALAPFVGIKEAAEVAEQRTQP